MTMKPALPLIAATVVLCAAKLAISANGDTGIKSLSIPNPEELYPLEAKSAGQQGTARIKLCIGRNDDIISVSLQESSGYPLLDTAAVRVASGGKYRAATSAGQPVDSCSNLPVRFSLPQAGSVSGAPISTVSVAKVAYPPLSRENVEEGVVRLKLCVDDSDKLTEVSIADSSSFSLLDEAALLQARESTFKAATSKGKPISSCSNMPVRFALRTVSGSDYDPVKLASVQFAKAVAYYTGQGPTHTKDLKKAVAYLRLASEKGNADAQYILGLMHQNGEALAKDPSEAAKLYTLAALQGHRNAQKALGFMFANGEGVPKNLTEAYRWFYLAAVQSDPEAKEKRAILDKTLSDAQLKEARALITEAQHQISTPNLRRAQLYTSRE